MVAGNPLRIFQSERTGAHRYLQLSMQQATGRIAEIYVQHDRRDRSLRNATPSGQEEQRGAKDEAQTTFLHLLIISQRVDSHWRESTETSMMDWFPKEAFRWQIPHHSLMQITPGETRAFILF